MAKFQKDVVGGLGKVITIGDEIVAITLGPQGKRLKTYTVMAIENVRCEYSKRITTKIKAENENGRICTLSTLDFVLPLSALKE
jgi:hypothetical protein